MIPAAIGFASGYVGHGMTTNNWGMKAVYSGAFSAAAATIGYGVAGFSPASSMGNVFQHFSTAGALKYGAMFAANTALSHVIPSANIPFGNSGFGISLNPVAMMTAGISSSAGGGFRFGAGISAHQRIGDWTLSAGLSSQGKGFGNAFLGASYDDGTRGFSYHHNWYMQGGTQRTGTIGARAGDWSLRWENDVLARNGDRFRSNATELGYKNYLVGTNVYTTDPVDYENRDYNNNGSNIFNNKNGTYKDGYQLSSPLYIGKKTKYGMTRVGLNRSEFGDFFQNGFHHLKLPFIVWGFDAMSSGNFQLGNYSNIYYQSGRYMPNSLY
ncbi:hypothetical protein D0T53_10290 [Dysgonomonas sp. 216]|uniref:polymorphic toxin type 23 domain-containing protein n=1 Tax=Dysgonomonas sp. 216 TaxID=2302934 RepID=UPI0013D54740|nr:polymorphic toxin type 23 domain-containing protein [Dysgonomonas sp. 216]NDW19300.1 hypothetical protein [Dysgonomonas sp. 216]